MRSRRAGAVVPILPWSTMITPFVFHSGWANAMSAVTVAKDVC
jgi:hypothetical protein